MTGLPRHRGTALTAGLVLLATALAGCTGDRATFNDPGNGLIKTSYGTLGQSMVRVPGSDPWDPGDGAHGVVICPRCRGGWPRP